MESQVPTLRSQSDIMNKLQKKRITELTQANILFRKKKYPEALAIYRNILKKDELIGKIARFNIDLLLRKKFNKKINKIYSVIAESGMFDYGFYSSKYAEQIGDCDDLIEHYISIGAPLNFDPSTNFSTKFYRENNGDVERSGINPFYHYIKHGLSEGRESLPKSEDAGKKISVTNVDLIRSSKLYDELWYKNKYFDQIQEQVQDYASHYLNEGYARGFDPGPDFSTLGYLGYYRDVLAAGLNPLVHYIKSGAKEGRKPKPDLRAAELGLSRLTPAESGKPDSILAYDKKDCGSPSLQNESIAVHVHLYHEEMLAQVCRYLSNISHPYSLLISVKNEAVSDEVISYCQEHLPDLKSICVKAVINRGRDVAPWLVNFKNEIQKSTIFLHIHTKKSAHNQNHTGWFRFLLHNTLGSKSVVDQILQLLSKINRIGVVSPCYFWSLANQPNYGKNKDKCAFLYRKIRKKPLPEICKDYPAGSFFWARTEVLKPLFDLNLRTEDFDEEKGQIDETLAHGVERIIGLLPEIVGMTFHKVTVDVAFDMVNYIYSGRDCDRRNFLINAKNKKVRNTRKNNKIAFFTCISGNYEEPLPLSKSMDGCDFYLFTDEKGQDSQGEIIKRVSNYISHIPVMTARFVKTHAHLFLDKYDYVCWIDSNIYFYGNIDDYISRVEESGADLGVIYHPARTSFIEESVELIQTSKASSDLLNRQVDRYRKFPDVLKSRLIETNFMIFRPNNPKIINMMNIWWGEINNYTHRDQMSVNFAAWKSSVKVVELFAHGGSVRDNTDFIIFEHGVTGRTKIIQDILSSAD